MLARKVHGQGDLRDRIRRDQALKSVCELLDQTLPETDPSWVFHYTSLVPGPRWVFSHLWLISLPRDIKTCSPSGSSSPKPSLRASGVFLMTHSFSPALNWICLAPCSLSLPPTGWGLSTANIPAPSPVALGQGLPHHWSPP